MITAIMNFLNRIIPKSNTIIFNSYPAYSDNSYYLFDYIMRERSDIYSKYDIYWAQDKEQIPFERKDIKHIRKKSILGVWRFLRSKYIISTHGYFPGVKSSNGQLQINLWHGSGYKKITQEDRIYRGDETIVTSGAFVKVQAEKFDMPEDSILVTGLPRNDVLFDTHNALKKLGVSRSSFNQIFLWMPTYRKASTGHLTVDGDVNSFGVGSISDAEYQKLDELLKRERDLLIIKLHPMDTISTDRLIKFQNIICYTNMELREHDVEIYDLLPETDCLLSDYSSVIIDYLLLGKPIAMTLSDIEEYNNSRGFVFNPIQDYFPGPIISCFDELTTYITDLNSYNAKWQEKRTQLQQFFHKYVDNHSSERVCNHIFGEK